MLLILHVGSKQKKTAWELDVIKKKRAKYIKIKISFSCNSPKYIEKKVTIRKSILWAIFLTLPICNMNTKGEKNSLKTLKDSVQKTLKKYLRLPS